MVCRKETGACEAAGDDATRDSHDTKSMAEVSGAGEGVDGGMGRRCGRRRRDCWREVLAT